MSSSKIDQLHLIELFHRTEFGQKSKLDKSDFGAIEYYLRKGRRQLEIYGDPGIKNIVR